MRATLAATNARLAATEGTLQGVERLVERSFVAGHKPADAGKPALHRAPSGNLHIDTEPKPMHDASTTISSKRPLIAESTYE